MINKTRIHGLDAIRGLALILGVALHSSMSFLPGIQIWIVADESRSPVLSTLFFVLHMFRMLLFFVLAGFFAHMSYHRLGLKNFVLDRLKRITLPFVTTLPLLVVSFIAILIWNATIANGGTPPPQPTPALSAENFPLLHLWFLYLLMLFYIATLVLRPVLRGLTRVADGIIRLVFSWVGILLLALPMSLALYYHPNWLAWFGIPTPDTSLYPNLPAIIAYGTAFAFGWLLERQTVLLNHLEQRWVFYLGIALAGTVFYLGKLGFTPILIPAAQDNQKLLYAALYSIIAWNWVFAWLGFALKFWNQPSAVGRYFADASYWIYLVHLPLVMVFQTLLSKLEWSWGLKFPIIVMAVLLIALSSYHLLIRHSFIGVILNGKRAKN